MKSKTVSSISLLLLGSLLLAGCTSGTEDGGSSAGDTENPIATGPSYTEKWDEQRPEDLLFPRGEYSFTYRETNIEPGLASWNGEGTIGFYEDGTCAFRFDGVKTTATGEEITYTIGKKVEDNPFITNSLFPYWANDQLALEADYRTNFPSMGAFPRHKNFASFCSLQALEQITTTGNAAVGQRRWSLEGGAEFAKEGKEWFIDYNLFILKIEDKDKAEATEILELMFYGTENIFTFDGEVKIETLENGTVQIVNGVENETSVFSEFILTPLSQPMELKFPTMNDMEPATPAETAGGYIYTFGSGIDYLRDIKRMYDEFAADNGSGASSEETVTEGESEN